jgi:hypothetical protein
VYARDPTHAIFDRAFQDADIETLVSGYGGATVLTSTDRPR